MVLYAVLGVTCDVLCFSVICAVSAAVMCFAVLCCSMLCCVCALRYVVLLVLCYAAHRHRSSHHTSNTAQHMAVATAQVMSIVVCAGCQSGAHTSNRKS